MHDDFILEILGPQLLRDLSIIANVVSAAIIGPWLAFAVSQDAGIRCRVALTRLVHRYILGGFSLVLMYNAYVVYMTDGRIPPGSALLLNLFILLSTLISAYRHWTSPAIPANASWQHPMVIYAGIRWWGAPPEWG